VIYGARKRRSFYGLLSPTRVDFVKSFKDDPSAAGKVLGATYGDEWSALGRKHNC